MNSDPSRVTQRRPALSTVPLVSFFVSIPLLHLLYGRQQRLNEGNNGNSSDGDTDGDDTEETPRLTPATMVDRSASQGGRCPPPPKAAPSPPTAIPPTRSPRDLEKEERERGNAKFGQGDFEGAVKCYTRYGGVLGGRVGWVP